MTTRWKIAQWFELRWWKNYLHGKDKSTYLQWKRNYWQTLLQKISKQLVIKPGQTIADLGCGPAGIFIVLPDHKVTAVDPLLEQYEIELPFFSRADYPNTNFVNCTIEAFAPTQKFDVVFCMNAINHVHDITAGFEKLKQACQAGGTIVVTIDAHNYAFFKHLFRLIPGDVLHPHQYDLEEYKNYLSTNGWQVAEPVLLKQEFFFNHYLLVAKKQ